MLYIIVVLRTDKGAVAVSLWNILLGCQDKRNHRKRFALQDMLFRFPL